MLPSYRFSPGDQKRVAHIRDAFEAGLRAHQSGDHAAARNHYINVLAADPEHPDTLHLLGVLASQAGDHLSATKLIGRAIHHAPARYAYHVNLGTALLGLRRLAEAMQSFDSALALKPDAPEVLFNRGNVWKEMLLPLDAAADYARALALQESFPEAAWSEAFCLLMAGDYARGLPAYEVRREIFVPAAVRDRFGMPPWLGKEPVAGKTVLLHAEQGLGDSIQFCRFAAPVAALGARVVLEVPAVLAELMRTVEGVSEVVVRGGALPHFDLHCPLMSLPLALGTREDTIPAPARYLSSTPERREKWAARLGPRVKPRVGVTWSSTSDFEHDDRRSVPLREFLRALPEDFDYICLQKEIKETDRATLAANPSIRFFGDDIADFADTAALADAVDVVVTTCTATPHLAGALGRPTWVLLGDLPDWRWHLDRADSPWYPSARLYRAIGYANWGSVFDQVREDLLREWAA